MIKIDNSRLTRDYSKEPVKKIGFHYEIIPFEDFRYLYIELNLRKVEIANYLNTSESYIVKLGKLYNLKKTYKQIIENMRQTTLERHGVDNPSKSEYFKQKRTNNNIKKYGVENVFQLQEIKEKSQQTCLTKYGKISYRQTNEYTEKYIKTCLEKYGTIWAFQAEEVKKKIKETNKIRYNFEYSSLNDIIQNKINSHKKIHYDNNYFDSNEELSIYKLLKEKFQMVEVHYKSKEYPFWCDFYIPELNLYIEYQGYWMHGKEPFDKNNKLHTNKIIGWYNKNTRKYNRAINIWCVEDVVKRQIAKANNLNYLEFFSMKEFMEWYEKQ